MNEQAAVFSLVLVIPWLFATMKVEHDRWLLKNGGIKANSDFLLGLALAKTGQVLISIAIIILLLIAIA